MSNVYFVRMNEMREGYYDGYTDYYRLAELSGYPVIWFDEIDPESDNTYVVTPLNGSNANGWQQPKARIILHDMEWRLAEGGHTWDKSELVIPPGVSEVWASDKWYAGIIGAKYVPLGSHPGLAGSEPALSDRFDVTLQAYLSGRRTFMADRLTEHGLTIAPARWNPERNTLLKSTTAMLHIHQWDAIQTVAPLRYALAAAYSLPLISEQVRDRDIFDGVVLFTNYDVMPAYTSNLVRRYGDVLRERGQALHELLCNQHSFKKTIDAAL